MASQIDSKCGPWMRGGAAVLLVALGVVPLAACKRDRVVGAFCMRDGDCETEYCRAGTCQAPPPASTTTGYPTTTSTGGTGGTGGAGGVATGGTGGAATGGTGGAAGGGGGTAGAGG